MSEHKTWQVASKAATVYEQDFVPALFAQWAPQVVDAVPIEPAERVLDVGCGTGVLAREVARRAGPTGQVTGLDLNADMLTVARRLAPEIVWRKGDAADLPFTDATFDVVVCQFALMFFPEPVAALREKRRVLIPGGRLAVAVWAPLERASGEAALTEILERRCGQAAADMLRAPFVLGDVDRLNALFRAAGVVSAAIETRQGKACFASTDEFIRIEVKGSPIDELLDDASYAALLEYARKDLTRFCVDGGEVGFPMDAHIVTARKPAP